jgi:hypothetical protein
MWPVKGFFAGFASTLLFHQGALYLLNMVTGAGRAVWAMQPVPPLGIPSVISLALFGGLWGVLLAWLLRTQRGVGYWLMAIGLGALLPSLVALLVVFPLKGMAFAAGGDVRIWIAAFILNGAWGLGVALLLKLRVAFSG